MSKWSIPQTSKEESLSESVLPAISSSSPRFTAVVLFLLSSLCFFRRARMNKITRRTIMIPAAIERPMIHSIHHTVHQYSPFRYDRSQTTHIITNSKITGMGCRMKCYRASLYMVIFSMKYSIDNVPIQFI